MAIKKTIEIDVSTIQAVGGLDNLSKALEKVDASAKGVEATFEEVYGDLKPLTARMGEAEDRLYELALAGQSASKEYKDLLVSVGQYRQVQMKTDLVVDAAATTFDTKLGGALQGATSAFAGIQGAMALTGGQSEELEAAILKVQGAMALAEGVRGIREGSVAFQALGTSAKTALAGIRTGIAATGIGLLVIALGAIVAYWDDIKEAVNGVSSEQETLNQQSQTNLNIEQEKLDVIGGQDNILKLQGKSEKEILKIKLAQTDQVIKASEIQIEQSIATAKAQTEAAKRNQEILAGVLKFLSLPLTMILKTVDAVGAALGKDFGLEDKVFKGLASFVFDPKETQAEGDKVVAEQRKALDKLKNDRAGLQLSINNIDKQASKEAADRRKETADKNKEAKDKALQDEIDALNEQSKILAQGREIAKANDEKRIEDLKAFGEKKTEELNNQLAQQEAIRQKELENEQIISDGKKAIQESSFAVVESGLGLLKTLFEKNKGLQKAALIAESAIGISKIVINTQAANAAARLKYALIPGGAALAAAEITLNRIGAGIGIATNIAATAKGLSALGGGSAKGGSSSGGDTGGGSAPTMAAPSFNVVGNSGVNQIAQTLGAQQPVQAYVVANNVTTQQALDRNIVRNASIG
jgi:hypothetical protein